MTADPLVGDEILVRELLEVLFMDELVDSVPSICGGLRHIDETIEHIRRLHSKTATDISKY